MKTALTIVVLLSTFACKAQTEWPDSVLAYYQTCEFCLAANFMFVVDDKGSIELFDDYDKLIEVTNTFKKVAQQDSSILRKWGLWEFDADRKFDYSFINYSNVPLNKFYPKKSGFGTILIVCTNQPTKFSRKTIKMLYEAAMEKYRDFNGRSTDSI
jgi:hypothetical protein